MQTLEDSFTPGMERTVYLNPRQPHWKSRDGKGIPPVTAQEHPCGPGKWQWLRVRSDKADLPQGSWGGPRQRSMKVMGTA